MIILMKFMAAKKTFTLICLALTWVLLCSWGFYSHRLINQTAIYTLPAEMSSFFKKNIVYITEHSVDPDKRRYVVEEEGSRHFIDLDRYREHPSDSIPRRWSDAVAKYSEEVLHEYGTLPWQIHLSYVQLTEAFKQKNTRRILRISTDLGHYIADAHSPLHTTQNYNGQLTNQHGIHAFWESRLPELFAHGYSFFVGKAQYINNPLKTAWEIVENSYSLTDSVLSIEARLNNEFPENQKYIYETRNNILTRTYSKEYSTAYHDALDGMVERQMRSSISLLGSFWFTAWVDAGQPRL
jgi:hypothetical protein